MEGGWERVDRQLEEARALLASAYPDAGAPLVAFSAPGRSEIAGNHTDHEGGRVIACAIDCGLSGVAAPRDDLRVRVASAGFEPFTLDLSNLEPRAEEEGTSAAIVRGMAAQLVGAGFAPRGFDMALTSTIPSGGGLSSSAAFELATGRAMEALWQRTAPLADELDPDLLAADDGAIPAPRMAAMAQRAENRWFGKPCGLMDQLAIALGGISLMDFAEARAPVTSSVAMDFNELGYDLVLVNVGASHDDLTDEYAAVPREMQAVARAFRAARLSEVASELVVAKLAELRAALGDRAVLRALHYFIEDGLVAARWQALLEGDMGRFLDLTNRSGSSSAMFLQNVSVAGSAEQPAMVALALAALELGEDGAFRIHGGGFGGSIQAFVPVARTASFMECMDRALGEGAARRFGVVGEGASAWRLP